MLPGIEHYGSNVGAWGRVLKVLGPGPIIRVGGSSQDKLTEASTTCIVPRRLKRMVCLARHDVWPHRGKMLGPSTLSEGVCRKYVAPTRLLPASFHLGDMSS